MVFSPVWALVFKDMSSFGKSLYFKCMCKIFVLNGCKYSTIVWLQFPRYHVSFQYKWSDVQMASEWRPAHILYTCNSFIWILQRNQSNHWWASSLLLYFVLAYILSFIFHRGLKEVQLSLSSNQSCWKSWINLGTELSGSETPKPKNLVGFRGSLICSQSFRNYSWKSQW